MSEKISFSRAETTLIMEPIHSNVLGNVHGGELMRIMDNTAGIAAFKHAKGTVVTARVDEIVFHRPINVGDIITCTGQLAYVGSSSMQVLVKIVVHDLNNHTKSELATTAFFTMVHLKDGIPADLPRLVITTTEEEEIYKLGEKKYQEIKEKYNGKNK